MRLHRPISGENIRPLLLFSVTMVVLSLLPTLSHAVVFWDDELEAGTPFGVSFAIGIGAMAYDTNVKFSGSGSTRLNFNPECEPATFGGAGCGGGASRTVPLTDTLYRRVYFRMSGQGPVVTSTGLFQTAIGPFTKMLRTTTNGIAKLWWMMGCCGSKKFLITLENVPPGASTNFYSSATLADNRWYCIETHEKLNTPGVANGIAQAWIDGAQVMNVTNIKYREAGDNSLWDTVGVFRQTGRGNIWWDRYATGNTRIGCSGSSPQGDTTAPTTPAGVSVR
ncbi:MAG: hypothetical protein L0H94_06365 [Nitrospira sp.]|nr:hypothetical protein [Nitrospira sp.]